MADKNRKRNKGSKKHHGGMERLKPGLDPRAMLEGGDLRRIARHLTRAQTRPQIRSAQRTVHSLRDILGEQVGDVTRLGEQARGDVRSYYRSLAEAEHQNVGFQNQLANRLNQGVNQAGQQAQGNIGDAGSAALERLQADAQYRGQGSSAAKDQLVNMIASQQARQAAEQQALGAQAQAQGQGFSQLQQALASASQMRGGQQMSDIARASQQGVSDLQRTYGPDIREALGNLKDVRSTKGDIRNQILRQLIGEERDFMLSKGALGLDRKSLKTETRQNRKGNNIQLAVARQYGRNDQRSARANRRNIRLQGQISGRNERIHGRQSRRYLQQQQSGSGGGGKGDGYSKKDFQRARYLAMNDFPGIKKVNSRKQFNYIVGHLVSRGVDSAAAKAAVIKLSNYNPRKLTKRERHAARRAGRAIGGINF